MASFASVPRTMALAVFGLAAASGSALAQPDEPKARCPQEMEGKECPPSETTTTTETETETTTTEPAPMAEPSPPPATTVEPAPPMYTGPVVVEEEEDDYFDVTDYGISVALAGGLSGFTDDIMRDATDDGGAWGVRATMGLTSIIGFEAEYTGSAQSIDALGLDDDALLVGNGLQGAARLNLFNEEGVVPFVFGGVAWRHYNLSSEGVNTSDIADDDDVLEIPVGGGLGYTYEGFLLEARGEFRYSAYEDMVPDALDFESFDDSVDGADMHRYSVVASVGYAF